MTMVTTYQQLCPVLFGVGAADKIGEKAREFGARKAYCIYDRGVRDSGIARRVVESLEAAGVECTCFDEVQPDAPDTLIDKIGKEVYGGGYQLVVGIGGGSSMDTAKAVSVLVDNPPPIRRYFASQPEPPVFERRAKLILVPTAAGTGSEVTIMSVVHDIEKEVKDAVLRHADLAIVDPALTCSAPPAVTASSGLDAMSHAVEAYTSAGANPKADILALRAIELIARNLEPAWRDGGNLECRTQLSFASNIAGMAFSDASVHVGHCAAHEMGLRFHMPHGVACAITIPATITFCADVLPEKTREIARALGVQVSDQTPAREAGQRAADAVRDLMRRVEIPSLKQAGYSREEVLACAEGAIANNWFHIMAPKPIDVEAMRRLLGEMYDLYQ